MKVWVISFIFAMITGSTQRRGAGKCCTTTASYVTLFVFLALSGGGGFIFCTVPSSTYSVSAAVVTSAAAQQNISIIINKKNGPTAQKQASSSKATTTTTTARTPLMVEENYFVSRRCVPYSASVPPGHDMHQTATAATAATATTAATAASDTISNAFSRETVTASNITVVGSSGGGGTGRRQGQLTPRAVGSSKTKHTAHRQRLKALVCPSYPEPECPPDPFNISVVSWTAMEVKSAVAIPPSNRVVALFDCVTYAICGFRVYSGGSSRSSSNSDTTNLHSDRNFDGNKGSSRHEAQRMAYAPEFRNPEGFVLTHRSEPWLGSPGARSCTPGPLNCPVEHQLSKQWSSLVTVGAMVTSSNTSNTAHSNMKKNQKKKKKIVISNNKNKFKVLSGWRYYCGCCCSPARARLRHHEYVRISTLFIQCHQQRFQP